MNHNRRLSDSRPLKIVGGGLRFGRSYLRTVVQQTLRRPVTGPATLKQAIDQWIGALGKVPPARGRILILALRNTTWIEWAVYCACVIRRMGFETTLAFDGAEVARLYPGGTARASFWTTVPLIPGIELIDLGQLDATEHAGRWRSAAAAWAPLAVAYDRHVEEHDVQTAPARYGAEVAAMTDRSTRLAAALAGLVAMRTFARCFLYSGLIGESKVLLDALRAAEIETVCLEGWAWRPGHMIYNLNAPALEYNVAGWMKSFGAWDAAKEREVDSYLKFLDGDQPQDAAWLDNFYRIQRDAVSAALPASLRMFLSGDEPVFVLAPNVIGDSSLLRRETIFPGQQVWTKAVIQWFAARPQLKLVIRAHPAERWIGAKCAVHMGEVARVAAANVRNVFVIGSEEDVNTFALIPYARAGLVWLSSAGVEFVVRGLPAVVAAAPKYGGLGIVREPGTVEDYFAELERLGATAVRPSREQIAQGRRYLFMVFRGFSFEATGRNYRATGCVLGAMANQPEHDRFYRILVGDEPMPDIEP
jgi:hypothetical protein